MILASFSSTMSPFFDGEYLQLDQMIEGYLLYPMRPSSCYLVRNPLLFSQIAIEGIVKEVVYSSVWEYLVDVDKVMGI